eukprot:scaffold1815_cov208-Amphora_coffeaeformis.AAC.13
MIRLASKAFVEASATKAERVSVGGGCCVKVERQGALLQKETITATIALILFHNVIGRRPRQQWRGPGPNNNNNSVDFALTARTDGREDNITALLCCRHYYNIKSNVSFLHAPSLSPSSIHLKGKWHGFA